MMSNLHEERNTYRVPTWAMPALFNGDHSGLLPHESEAVGNLEHSAINDAMTMARELGMPLRSHHWAYVDDPHHPDFCPINDLPGYLGGLGAECVDLTYVVLLDVVAPEPNPSEYRGIPSVTASQSEEG